MRKTFLILTAAAALLSGCAWETYQDGNGKTAVRQKYPVGTPVYYQDGSYSKNMNYNQYRPERHAVLPDQTGNNADDRVPPTLAKTKVSKPINLPYAV